ncbi:hypothetical protein RRG08_056076 [Elysia crispata]|uniref:Uncharacterized protein n=1 Tax=Elysia crispata TaxID=231223 RepID=A0AAE0ZBM4_9GAST|nr:hypothetical protein RRG08_056076 [Elysia crispata]
MCCQAVKVGQQADSGTCLYIERPGPCLAANLPDEIKICEMRAARASLPQSGADHVGRETILRFRISSEVKILNNSDPAQKISLESQELVSTELCVAPAMEKG